MNSFFERRYVIQGVFIVLSVCLLAKLFYIQLIDNQYALSANNNVVRKIIFFPARGPILDRNQKILVKNEANFDIWVTPRDVKPFDTLEFCKLLNISKEEFNKRWNKAITYSRNLSSPFERQIPLPVYQTINERLFEFPGFFAQPRTVRTYPDSVAAQFLGYIDEVTDRDIEKYHGYYNKGDYIGRSGVEKAYEDLLRGQRGVERLYIDSKGVTKGQYMNGQYDTAAVPGARLISSLDIRIQKLGEKLMHNKVGSIVAIEPSTGEILCFVSSPTYNPNDLVGRDKGNNAAKLNQNPYSPFFVRPIQARYSPGSSFKPVDALIALQEGIITPQTTFFCPHYYQAGNHRVACEHYDGVTDLRKGIAMSCNTYFCNVFDKLINANGPRNTRPTFVEWKAKVNKFGFGVPLDIDLPNESRGMVPSAPEYDKKFGSNQWRSSTIISLAIGQGELSATPLQMANIDCIIANRGFFYKPHLIKGIGDKKIVKEEYTVKNKVDIDEKYFEPVIDGMQEVVEHGTAASSRIPGIVMCGKTGTVQNSHGKNHSVFVGFAPRDNPRIAIAVVVENAGFGATWAAPIASFIVEKYLRDSITRRSSGIDPDWFMNQNLLPPVQVKGVLPVSKPLKIKHEVLSRPANFDAKPKSASNNSSNPKNRWADAPLNKKKENV